MSVFFRLFSSDTRRKVTKEVLNKLKWYMSNASSRGNAYRKISEEYGISVGIIKNAASKAGLALPTHSLHCILSAKEEDALVTIYTKYSRRNTPLTIPVFIELVSRCKCYLENHHFFLTFCVERCQKA